MPSMILSILVNKIRYLRVTLTHMENFDASRILHPIRCGMNVEEIRIFYIWKNSLGVFEMTLVHSVGALDFDFINSTEMNVLISFNSETLNITVNSLVPKNVHYKSVTFYKKDDLFITGGGVYPGTHRASNKIHLLVKSDTHKYSVLEMHKTLCEARHHIVLVCDGCNIFFAGGFTDNTEVSRTVDIFSDGNWTTAMLSVPRVEFAAASNDSKTMFGGGLCSSPLDSVDIYEDGTWTTTTLSQARFCLAAASDGHKIMFAGGLTSLDTTPTNTIDIYEDGIWTTATLSVARYNLSAVSDGTKIIFAGGQTSENDVSDAVDIYENGVWTTSTLARARHSMFTHAFDNNCIFVGGISTEGKEVPVLDMYTTQL